MSEKIDQEQLLARLRALVATNQDFEMNTVPPTSWRVLFEELDRGLVTEQALLPAAWTPTPDELFGEIERAEAAELARTALHEDDDEWTPLLVTAAETEALLASPAGDVIRAKAEELGARINEEARQTFPPKPPVRRGRPPKRPPEVTE